MRALYAIDVSVVSEAAIESETCLGCLARIGVDTIHLVGRSRIRRLLLGSVSEEIVVRATGNVFLVPPPRAA